MDISPLDPQYGTLNQVEFDSIMYLIIDVILAILNTYIAYKLLANNPSSLLGPIKRVLIALHLIFWLQIAGSAMMLPLIFRFRENENGAQLYLGFVVGRMFDMILLNFVMILFYKVMFSLKRVQIQMNEQHKTVKQTLIALSRYVCIERLILIFYFAHIVYKIIDLTYVILRIQDPT